MDILIEGLELPKNENDNFMVIVTPTGVIDVVENGNGFMMQKKYEAIELPPHGRLCDLDLLEEWMRKKHKEHDCPFNIDAFLFALKKFPTIVEASNGYTD